MFPARSFTAKGICVHEPVQGFNLNLRSISGVEPEMPVTLVNRIMNVLYVYIRAFHYQIFTTK